MLSIQDEGGVIEASVFGEFTLADLQGLELKLTEKIASAGSVKLLLDCQAMLSYSIDVIWEEWRFATQHHASLRIAIVSHSQWLTWLAVLQGVILEEYIQIFDNPQLAVNWLRGV